MPQPSSRREVTIFVLWFTRVPALGLKIYQDLQSTFIWLVWLERVFSKELVSCWSNTSEVFASYFRGFLISRGIDDFMLSSIIVLPCCEKDWKSLKKSDEAMTSCWVQILVPWNISLKILHLFILKKYTVCSSFNVVFYFFSFTSFYEKYGYYSIMW